MRKYRGKLLLIVAAVALAIYFLYPTYEDYQYQQTLAGLSSADSLSFVEANETAIREARAKRIKLGLDLQGGMRVVLEVNVLKLIEDLAKNRDETFTDIINSVRAESARSEESPVLILRRVFEERQIRMSRYYGSLRDDNDRIFGILEDEAQKAIDRGMEIVRNRVDQYGVSEPTIQKLGANRIIVELPGVSRESEVRQLLQGTALLEFKLVRDPEVTYRVMEAIDKALASLEPAVDTTAEEKASFEAADTSAIPTPEGELSQEEFAKEAPLLRGRSGEPAAVPR